MGRRRRAFTRIKGLTDQRRPPRIAKLYLGVKDRNAKGVQYPKDVDHFVVHPPGHETPSGSQEFYDKFVEAYGKTPSDLPIIIPSDNPDEFFPQSYRMYGYGKGIKCHGDGEQADCIGSLLPGDLASDEVHETTCAGEECRFYKVMSWVCGNPKCSMKGMILDRERGEIVGKQVDGKNRAACKKCGEMAVRAGGCRFVGTLRFILPDITYSGTIQVDTGAVNGILDLNSALGKEPDGWVRRYFGTVCGLMDKETLEPLLHLKRVARETHGGGFRRLHWPLAIEIPNLDRERLKTLQVLRGPALLMDAVDAREMPQDLYPAELQQPSRPPVSELPPPREDQVTKKYATGLGAEPKPEPEPEADVIDVAPEPPEEFGEAPF